jgi:hypothetical protein
MSQTLNPDGRKRLLLVFLLLASLAWLLFQQTRGQQTLADLPLYDFVEYWAAGRLALRGENPYDAARIGELQQQAGHSDAPILMWNPPWVLPLVLPLGLFDVRVAHLLWLLGHLLVLVGCADLLWRHYGGPSEGRVAAWVLALVFLPCPLALLAGQISPLLLAGAAGFLVALRGRRDFLAGAATALLAIKPHLASLFWLALLVWVVRERRWKVALGGLTAGLGLTALALVFDPQVLGQYWHTLTTTPPAQYRSPTLGTLLRLAAGDGPFRLQFVALVPGLAWLVLHLVRSRRWDWDAELPLLLLVSFLTAPYGAWPFDLVVLLVPVLRLAALLARSGDRARIILALGVYLALGTLGWLMLFCEVEYLYFIWMTPALLLAYLGLAPSASSLRYTNQPQQAGPVPG